MSAPSATRASGPSFWRFANSEWLSDVTIFYGPNRQLFRAHKILLCSKSEKFSKMFLGDQDPYGPSTVEVTDCHPDAMAILLSSFYRDDVGPHAFGAIVDIRKRCNVRADRFDLQLILSFYELVQEYGVPERLHSAAVEWIVMGLRSITDRRPERDEPELQPLLSAMRRIYGSDLYTENVKCSVFEMIRESVLDMDRIVYKTEGVFLTRYLCKTVPEFGHDFLSRLLKGGEIGYTVFAQCTAAGCPEPYQRQLKAHPGKFCTWCGNENTLEYDI